MYSWHDFNKYHIYDTNTHRNYLNNARKSNPSKRVTFVEDGGGQSRPRNSSRFSNGTAPPRRPPMNILSNRNTPALKDRRLTNTSMRLFGSNLIGHHHLHVSETRSAFQDKTPKKSPREEYKENNNTKLLDRIKYEHNSKPKFQESPAFSLRKTIPGGGRNRRQNKVIDVNQVEEIVQKRGASLPSKSEEKRKLFVTKGISSFLTPVNLGPQSNTFGILEDPKKFVEAVTSKDNMADGRFRFIVDMSEYHNDQIQLLVKGKKLIIEGNRPQQEPWISQRKTSEMVELPPHVHADNLRVDRDTNGLLYFEEAWKF